MTEVCVLGVLIMLAMTEPSWQLLKIRRELESMNGKLKERSTKSDHQCNNSFEDDSDKSPNTI